MARFVGDWLSRLKIAGGRVGIHNGKPFLLQVKGGRERVSIPVAEKTVKVEKLLGYKKKGKWGVRAGRLRSRTLVQPQDCDLFHLSGLRRGYWKVG